MSQIKVGDVVRLKSGGPRMTVVKEKSTTPGQLGVLCAWHTEAGEAREHAFPDAALEVVTPGPAPSP